MRVGSEMVDSQPGALSPVGFNHLYPTSERGITTYYKRPQNIENSFPTLFVKTTDFQLVVFILNRRTVTIFGEHDIMALEFHYPMIQFLIIDNSQLIIQELAELSLAKSWCFRF